MTSQTIQFEKFIKTDPKLATHAFTNADVLRQWLCDVATVKPRPGGRLYLAWNSGYYSSGEYTTVEPGKQVGFTWMGRNDPGRSQVEVTVESRNDGLLLTLAHTLPNNDPDWQKTCEEIERGWRDSLENLASVLESGLDLRFVNRPMLGLTLSDFNAEIAREAGVPVSEGVRLDSVVEGMGAHAAGLRGGDVVVQVGDTQVRSINDIAAAIGGRRAGDRVTVVFYRGSEKQSVEMTLSRRPLPEIPASAGELAAELRSRYDKIEAELEEFFDGVSEEEASYHPGPGDWSAKEILAHLLQGERFARMHLAEVVTGYDSWSDDWGGNLDAEVRAIAAVYPTTAELLAEIKRSFAETTAFYASLPDNFAQNNKAGFWFQAYGALESPYHLHTHLEQMREAIEAGRKA